MRKWMVIGFILLISCTEHEIPTTFALSVTVKYPAEFSQGSNIPGAEVKVTNIQTGRIQLAVTGNDGKALFQLRGGNYNIVVTVSEEREIIIEGYPVVKNVIFYGALNGRLITSDENNFDLPLGYSVENEGFVIKELYTSGCRTPELQSYQADKFVEIYNNTDKVLYSDGLCFGVVHPTTTERPSPWVDANGKMLDRIPLWTFIGTVPGSGKEHPILPGKSFIMAVSALNHRDDPNGNPNSIDLSMAAWEFYVENGTYVDVPSVPNLLMQRITPGVKIMTFDVRGQVCILFRLPSNDLQAIFTDQNNFMVQPGGTFKCFMVPFGWVIDGVENARLSDQGVYKRLPDLIDVGYIQTRGSLEKVSIRRKVLKVINGRTVLKDTNNSSEDFLTNQTPTPGIIPTE